MNDPSTHAKHGRGRQQALSGLALVLVAALGIGALLLFFRQLLAPDDLGSLALPVVAIMAGLAATFNPCGLPALPGFLLFLGDPDEAFSLRRRAMLSLSTSLGAVALIAPLGLLVAVVGLQTKSLIDPYVRWVQLGIGLYLIAIATLHLMGRTHRLPLVGPVMNAGSRVWDRSVGHPTAKGSFLFGSGFVLVGVG